MQNSPINERIGLSRDSNQLDAECVLKMLRNKESYVFSSMEGSEVIRTPKQETKSVGTQFESSGKERSVRNCSVE